MAQRSRHSSRWCKSGLTDCRLWPLSYASFLNIRRYSTLTVIIWQTTFFVSIDSMLYGYASVAVPPDAADWSNIDLLKSATLGGSIILHVCACK